MNRAWTHGFRVASFSRMARARYLLVLAAACARPNHDPAPVAPPSQSIAHAPPAKPAAMKVAVLDPNGSGNWLDTLELSPPPASLATLCLEPGARGWISVKVDTHANEASTTAVVEASPETTPEARACVAKALTGLRTKLDAMSFLLYLTFSPE